MIHTAVAPSGQRCPQHDTAASIGSRPPQPITAAQKLSAQLTPCKDLDKGKRHYAPCQFRLIVCAIFAWRRRDNQDSFLRGAVVRYETMAAWSFKV